MGPDTNMVKPKSVERKKEEEVLVKVEQDEEIFITMWDLPLTANRARINRCMKYHGTTEIVEWHTEIDRKAAYMKIKCKNEEKKRLLKNVWAMHYESGKTVRITTGRFDTEELLNRKEFRLILREVPHKATEVTLLRQFINIKIKMVHIPNNRNGNQRGMAFVYLATNYDLQRALSTKPFYYNEQIRW